MIKIKIKSNPASFKQKIKIHSHASFEHVQQERQSAKEEVKNSFNQNINNRLVWG